MYRIQPHLSRILGRHVLIVVALIGLTALLGACSSGGPLPSPSAAPAPAPTGPVPVPSLTPALAPATASPSPNPLHRLTPASLLSPRDLTFDGAYSEPGWRRCDDYNVERNLQRYRGAYKVSSSVAAVWEFGSGCGSADQAARIDQYAWLVRDEGAAASMIEAMNAESYMSGVTPDLRSRMRQFGGSDVLVQVLEVPQSKGKTRFVAEITVQQGIAIAYMRLITDQAFTDDDYLRLARRYLDQVM